MTDSPQRALAEATEWLLSAERSLADAEENHQLANVSCSQSVYAIIRANDALCLEFLGHKCTRHEDAPYLFNEMVRKKKVAEGHAPFAEVLLTALSMKSGADYGKDAFTVKEAEKLFKRARDFVEMAHNSL